MERPVFRLGRAELLLLAVMAIGGVYTVIRFTSGLGAIANINNAYPWGWWTGFGILTLIAFGGAGFTIALLVDILGFHRFAPFVRPALTMGLLFYTGYALILLIELGRPWKFWMVFVSWQPTSALFEIAWCATLYTIVQMTEFGKIVAKKQGWSRLFVVLSWLYLPAVIFGVALSHMHQSSLGTLMTILPLKVDTRWWSELLPALFLLTAYSAGMALVSVEHVIATRLMGLQTRREALSSLALVQVVVISLFLTLRIGDMAFRGAAAQMLEFDALSYSLWIEIVLGFLVPLALFVSPDTRRTVWGVTTGSVLVLFGVLLNRLNVAVIAMKVRHWETYFPSAGEIFTTLAVVAAGILVYGILVRWLPIHSEPPLEPEPAHDPATPLVRPAGVHS